MPKKILIIDDDPVIVKYLKAVFSDNGYATCSAGSTMEGLEVVKEEKPHQLASLAILLVILYIYFDLWREKRSTNH